MIPLHAGLNQVNGAQSRYEHGQCTYLLNVHIRLFLYTFKHKDGPLYTHSQRPHIPNTNMASTSLPIPSTITPTSQTNNYECLPLPRVARPTRPVLTLSKTDRLSPSQISQPASSTRRLILLYISTSEEFASSSKNQGYW